MRRWLKVSTTATEPPPKRQCTEASAVTVKLIPAKHNDESCNPLTNQLIPTQAPSEQSGHKFWAGGQEALVAELQKQLKAKTEEVHELEEKVAAQQQQQGVTTSVH